MTFKANFHLRDIKVTCDKFVERQEKEQIAILYYLGTEYMNKARSHDYGNYTDRTGALRSSIGFEVLKDGQVMHLVTEGDNEEGVAEGNMAAMEIAQQFNRGLVLIVFAGMHYAIYVELLENFSVLTSAMPTEKEFIKSLSELL